MSKWEKTNLWLKQHYLCVIAWLVVVLIALIVVMAGNDKELVGHFGFACSLSGILLAIVVIIHTWIDSADTRIVLTEVNSHLTDILADVGKTASSIDQLRKAQNVFNIDLANRDVPKETVQTKQEQETESVPFRLSELSFFTILFFYCVVKSFREKRSFVLLDVIKKMFPKEEHQALLQYAFGATGVLMTFAGLAGYGQIDIPLNEQSKIKHIPPEICDAVEKEYNQQLKEIPPEHGKIAYAWKHAIDDYFTGLREMVV